jgi:hypothetical protein
MGALPYYMIDSLMILRTVLILKRVVISFLCALHFSNHGLREPWERWSAKTFLFQRLLNFSAIRPFLGYNRLYLRVECKTGMTWTNEKNRNSFRLQNRPCEGPNHKVNDSFRLKSVWIKKLRSIRESISRQNKAQSAYL